MLRELEFGTTAVKLSIPDSKRAGEFLGPQGQALQDVPEAVRSALASPLDAPPVTQALTPDDRITLILDAGLPFPAEFVEPLLENFAEAGVSADRVVLLLTPIENPEESLRVAEELRLRFPSCEVVVHDPSERTKLAYLASTNDGRRVYLNRLIADADAVVVVGRTGFDSLVGFRGTASHVFPALSDEECAVRSRQFAMDAGSAPDALRLRQQCDEVGWLMGLFYSMGAALDQHNVVEAVWFGQFKSVQKASEEHTRSRWTFDPPTESTDLIVAAVSPSVNPSDWAAVAEALETASRAAGPQTSLLILSDLADLPGKGCLSLVNHDNFWDAMEGVKKSDAVDSLAASKFARNAGGRKIYLFSRLAAELIESLALAPVANAKEITNIISRSESCFLIESADRARPKLRPAKRLF